MPPYIVITVPRIQVRAPEWMHTVARRTGLTAAMERYRTTPPRPGSTAIAAFAILVLALGADGVLSDPGTARTASAGQNITLPGLTFTPTGLYPGLAGDPNASLGLGTSPNPYGTLSPYSPVATPGAPLVTSAAQTIAVPPAAPPATVPQQQTTARAGSTTASSAVPAIPARARTAYENAARAMATADPACGLTWPLLAAIGAIESNHARYGGSTLSTAGVSAPPIYGVRLDGTQPGTGVVRDTDGGALDGDTQYDRAVGAMQFLPGTWKIYATDGDGDNVTNPQDLDDSTRTAARYLCQTRPSTGAGATLSTAAGQWEAAFRYNRSTSYANWVLGRATGYATGKATEVTTPPPGAGTTAAPAPSTSTTTTTASTTTITSTAGSTATGTGPVVVTVTVTATAGVTTAPTTTSSTTSTTKKTSS